ncbi:sigma-70 family RNA polymerase sigma factor [bacterium]|nr:sigma-70 family RNA polymerase sigma factor [bacterium]
MTSSTTGYAPSPSSMCGPCIASGKTRASFDELDDHPENELSLDLFCYAHGVYEDSPEQSVILNETMQAVEQAMRYLKPEAQEILIRRLMLRETPAQMAVHLGIAPERISGILFRAKEALRTQLHANLLRGRGDLS